MSSWKKIISILGTCGILVLLYFYIPTVSTTVYTLVKSSPVIENIKEELNALPGIDTASQNALNASNVIALTNAERAKENLPALTQNDKLTQAAQKKLDDMFAQQYFEHVSPQGNGPSYLADQVGYTYILVGENLALGNFKNDEALVAAWMASPGHRANIMHTRFKEIGVAVGEGTFNGKKTWLAVQEFGTPSSACPSIDSALKSNVDKDKTSLTMLNKDIQQRNATLQAMSRSTPSEQQEYNKKVDEYNALVVQYDTLSSKLSSEINTYNKEVQAYNACIKGN